MDPFRAGIMLTLGKTDKEVCPVTALMPYLAIRRPQKRLDLQLLDSTNVPFIT